VDPLASRLRHPVALAVLVAVIAGVLAVSTLPAQFAEGRGPSVSATVPADAFRPVAPLGAASVAPSAPTDVRPLPRDPADGERALLWAWRLVAQEPPPAVVRFRPRDASKDVARSTTLSVRFTTAMDRRSTEAAFSATVGTAAVDGSLSWAEDDTVLVLRPAKALAYGASIRLEVDATARSAYGVPLDRPAEATFTVASRPAPPPPKPRVTSATWVWPLRGPITQYFGQSLTKYGYHEGIDIDGDTGDRVVAARAGIVVMAGYGDSCGGLQVHVDHGGGIVTWYRHLSKIEVRVGAHVAAGTLIGRVGATGCAIGSHLHLAVQRNGVFVDPLRYLPRR
jgi:murein DD-endopeptidase MepM/ murein hydrolase activator NlpD